MGTIKTWSCWTQRGLSFSPLHLHERWIHCRKHAGPVVGGILKHHWNKAVHKETMQWWQRHHNRHAQPITESLVTLQMKVPPDGWAGLLISAIQLHREISSSESELGFRSCGPFLRWLQKQCLVRPCTQMNPPVLLALAWFPLSLLRSGSQMPGIYSPVKQNKHWVRM